MIGQLGLAGIHHKQYSSYPQRGSSLLSGRLDYIKSGSIQHRIQDFRIEI